jgi:hypothetical protein
MLANETQFRSADMDVPTTTNRSASIHCASRTAINRACGGCRSRAVRTPGYRCNDGCGGIVSSSSRSRVAARDSSTRTIHGPGSLGKSKPAQ